VTVLVAVAFIIIAGGASNGSSDPTYKVELDNSFGLVTGEQFKVAGVPAGQISNVALDQKTLHALITVQVNQSGLGSFHKDAFCESRPQSLIGEYFLNCDPGTSGPVLKSGSTIPITHTQSTIPADLVPNIMQLPYRERSTRIINEHALGNGTAIFTRAGDAAREFARRIQIGMVGINVPIPVPTAFYSFGGWKDSLFGDTHVHGQEGIRFYTHAKAITSRWPDNEHQEHHRTNMHFPTAT